jgi:hypothetical protein
MATRSIIRIKNGDSVYCHWDGYPSNNGKLLLNHFNKTRKIKKLLDLGDLSNLDKRIRPTKEHSHDQPQQNVTVAYHRDRGEGYKQSNTDTMAYVDYIYEWDGSRWFVYGVDGDNPVLLTKKIVEKVKC